MSSNTIIFITGANTGLGFEVVKSLCQSSTAYTILLGGRDLSKANAAAEAARTEFPSSASVIKTVQIDIEDDASITNAYEHISSTYGRLDVLINNAGALFDPLLHANKLSMREMWNKSWDVNTTGTYILTHTFIPLLLASSSPRLLFITSGTSTLAGHVDGALHLDKSPEKGWPK
ncbi:Short-chain dehydrogenase/reductase tropE, partial [Lachnellula suecica]